MVRFEQRVIALVGAVVLVAVFAGAAGAAFGRSLEAHSELIPTIGAFLAALATGLLTKQSRRAAAEAFLSSLAAFALAWMMKNAVGAAWPEVLRFSVSWTYAFLSTLLFGLAAIADLSLEVRLKPEPSAP
jgi:hypothetical protein